MEKVMGNTQEDTQGFCSPREKAEHEWFHFKDDSQLGDLLQWLRNRFEYVSISITSWEDWDDVVCHHFNTLDGGPDYEFKKGSVLISSPETEIIDILSWESFQHNYLVVESEDHIILGES